MRILIVEDDELISNLIDENLKLEGFETIVCNNGLSAIEVANNEKPDCIVLDVMLPGLDGFHVCKSLQGSGIPIIMLTAKTDITDKLTGLEAGADDYMVKPFDSRELVARIRTIFRRLEMACIRKSTSEIIRNNDNIVSVDEDTRRVYINDNEIELTHTEFDLTLFFSKNPGRVFTRSQLMDAVWGYDFLGDSRTVDIHIQRIRKKMGNFSDCIETVFGVGYRFRELKK